MVGEEFSLQDLSSFLDGELLNGDGITVTELFSNSRICKPGGLFVALRGNIVDSHQFIDDAKQHGAVAAVVEDPSFCKDFPCIVVSDTRRALSRLAAKFSGFPSEDIFTIGITGTNGKTTIAWSIYHILRFLGKPPALSGTLGSKINEEPDEEFNHAEDRTTLDPITLQKFFRRALEKRAEYLIMEVSSHAIDQHRAGDINFNTALFTNLSQDHLDYHHDMESYFEVKTRLFLGSNEPTAVVNIDDAYGKRLAESCREAGRTLYTFGTDSSADFHLQSWEQSADGVQLLVESEGVETELRSHFIGSFNIENMLAVFSLLRSSGFDAKDIASAMSQIPPVPGRLEPVKEAHCGVFIDFAHTPDAISKALQALRPLTRGKLWILFGCGGEKDQEKRPLMGLAAAEHADCITVTSDNPRSEDPEAIIQSVLSSGIIPDICEADRKKAIFQTLELMTEDDIVLLAGKGHEEFQEIGKKHIPFSEREIVLEFYQRKQ